MRTLRFCTTVLVRLLANTLPTNAHGNETLTVAKSGLQPATVSFPSGNGSVVGHLYLPENYNSSKRYPAVAVAGSFSSVKEMMAGIYAGEMSRRGVMALSIDYRNYGQSSGILRQYEDPESKAADLSAALKFLASRPDVAGTGLLGICTSGGTVLYTAVNDPHVKAVATVVGSFKAPAKSAELYGGDEGIVLRRAAGLEARELYERTHELKFIRAYSSTENTTVNYGPQAYYDDPARGGSVRAWRNDVAVLSWNAWFTFDPVSRAPLVKTPTLMIHSENAAFPDQARAVYDGLAGEKKIIWTNGTHYDFYDRAERVHFSADRVAAHFQALLK